MTVGQIAGRRFAEREGNDRIAEQGENPANRSGKERLAACPEGAAVAIHQVVHEGVAELVQHERGVALPVCFGHAACVRVP